jgi:DNA repair protein RadD
VIYNITFQIYTQDLKTLEILTCGYRFRYKICHKCSSENDITARVCTNCDALLIDADSKLRQAKLSKNAHVMKPDMIKLEERKDKNGNPYVEIKYFDYDAKYFSEFHFLNNPTSLKKFNIDFLRSHLRRPELGVNILTAEEVVRYQGLLRMPAFIIARKQGKFWKITEKIFVEELSRVNPF